MKHETLFGLIIAGLAALLLWWLNKGGLLHESVTSGIVTSAGTITSDNFGLPQFDLRDARTYRPAAYAQAVWPVCGLIEGTTATPSDPKNCSCPSGFQLYHEVSQNHYLCLPNGVF